MIRMHPGTDRLEVYDGSSWHEIANGSAEIDLSPTAKETLTWAREKMVADKRLKVLMERHPGLQELHNKFEVMRLLCEQGDHNNEMV
jgi:hypothetical protein